ncbi:DUF1707 domain-containing protein [Kribbella sp. NPDC056951]|uniref:DUF1707 SHOCT-like domain-containing protein n=1 Tax=Kribbella sp. NPDC056951 TaxID=3345978 RepID=UPI003642BBE8
MSDEGPMRIGDAEREEAVRRLGEHYEAGRLTAEEHGERVEAALRARTGDELAAIFGDLPTDRERPPHEARTGAPGGRGPRGQGRPGWAGRGPFGRIPVPLLVALGVIALVASVGCVVGGGHPPVLLIAALVAGVIVYRKRRMA